MLRMCNTETIESVYKLGKRLGAGAGGTVYLGTHLGSGQMAAVKNIDLAAGEKKVQMFLNYHQKFHLRRESLCNDHQTCQRSYKLENN